MTARTIVALLAGGASPRLYTLGDFRGNRADLRPESLYSSPWEGGWWRLRDAVDYMETVSIATLDYAAKYGFDLLYNRYQAGRDTIARYRNEPPFAYVVPQEQRDPVAAVELLRRLAFNGLRVSQLREAAVIDGIEYPAGTWVLPMDQEFAETRHRAPRLPVRNVVADAERDEFFSGGSVLEVISDPAHPVMSGMPERANIFFARSPVFTVEDGFRGAALAKYQAAGTPLVSGYLLGEEHVQGYAAALDVRHGDGHVVLIGFRPQWRGQPFGTFRVLFSAALFSGEVAAEAPVDTGFWQPPPAREAGGDR